MSHAGDGHSLRAAGKLQRWAAAGAAAVAALAAAAALVTSGLEAGQASARTRARAFRRAAPGLRCSRRSPGERWGHAMRFHT